MLGSVVRQRKGGKEESMLSEMLPLVRCKKCGIGTMLPLSDYGQDGAAILYKAWVCDSPTCGYNLRMDRGQVTTLRRLAPVEVGAEPPQRVSNQGRSLARTQI